MKKEEIENRLLQLGGRTYFVCGKDNWYMEVDYSQSDLVLVENSKYIQHPGVIYFDKADDLFIAICKIGDLTIMEGLFQIKQH